MAKLTPDEMKEAGLGHLMPAEAHGRDNGPRSRHLDEFDQPEDVQSENERLGLDTGPITRDMIQLDPNAAIVSGDWGPSPIGALMKDERTRDISDTVRQVGRVENAAGNMAAAAAGGAVVGPAIDAAVLPSPGYAAAAARMASSAAAQRARAGVTEAASPNLLAMAVKLLLGHNPYLKAAQMASRALPAAAGAARQVAGPMGAAGAGAVGGGATILDGQEHETPEQKAARILLGQMQQPQFNEGAVP